MFFVDFVVYTWLRALPRNIITKYFKGLMHIFNRFHTWKINRTCKQKALVNGIWSLRAKRRDLHLTTNYQQLSWMKRAFWWYLENKTEIVYILWRQVVPLKCLIIHNYIINEYRNIYIYIYIYMYVYIYTRPSPFQILPKQITLIRNDGFI